MIIFRDVSRIYQMGDEELRALDHVNLHIRQGEFVSIIGPSGSGKSTLMNIIGCLDTADEGEYLLDGQPIGHYSERELTKIRSRKIGFVFQSFNLIHDLTAEENVELPLIYQRVRLGERRERVREALERVGLYDRRNHRPNQLSGGQQQRVAIARAMAGRPSLFLADEPTGNLDSRTGAQIMEIFHELHAAGNTIVLITHDESIAVQAQRQIHIRDGRVEEQPYNLSESDRETEPAHAPTAADRKAGPTYLPDGADRKAGPTYLPDGTDRKAGPTYLPPESDPDARNHI